MVKIASSSMAKLSIHELCVLIIITSFASIVISTTTESVKPTKKSALFVFGDSLFDPGNNQYINGSKPGASSYYPYGQTFFNHPTGRLSDGRIVPDFIALFAKLPMLTPYLQPGGEHDFTAGTNFASAGACALDAPHPQMAAIDLNEQLSYFKKVEEWLKQKLGNEEAKKLLKRAVYLFSIGGNDYFTLSSSYPNITLSYQKEYVGMVIGNLTNVLQEIYEMGGRKIAFQNAGPLGCTPGKRFEHLGNCDQLAMSLATLHNTLLAQSLKNLESHLPGFQYSIFDYYNALYDRIANPSKYGFEEGKSACCGSGQYRASNCGVNNGTIKYELCSNPSKYVWFDSAHTTEETNFQLANLIWSGHGNVTGPYNVKQLFGKSFPAAPFGFFGWLPLAVGVYKLNFDGVMGRVQHVSSLGVIVRNNLGQGMASLSEQVGLISDVDFLEAEAALLL
ncbi:unnamed protein product [Camellia sinensis]